MDNCVILLSAHLFDTHQQASGGLKPPRVIVSWRRRQVNDFDLQEIGLPAGGTIPRHQSPRRPSFNLIPACVEAPHLDTSRRSVLHCYFVFLITTVRCR